MTGSVRVALQDLNLDRLCIVCPGDVEARLDDRIEVCGIRKLPENMAAFEGERIGSEGRIGSVLAIHCSPLIHA